MSGEFGGQMPDIRVTPPGPRSLRFAERLAAVESPNVTYLSPTFPVFWSEAAGSNVRDVDGNVYIDLTAAFAVAAAGHSHPAIVAAIRDQAGRLMHGMGDVHPPALKVDLLEALAEVTPGGLCQSILANSGAEAVEAALKTVLLATGRQKVIAFRGAYHGLTLGALSVSGRSDFSEPFRSQLADLAVFAEYPRLEAGSDERTVTDSSLREIEHLLDSEAGGEVGAILAEPVQGRGGDLVPPRDWLRRLRDLCDSRGLLLVLDEIYTGFGRTGKWFACEHSGVVPDLLVVGKGLSGGMPFAACIGTREVMSAWPRSRGEALHTSTFLGHPLGCAAALASIETIRAEGLVERSRETGAYIVRRLSENIGSHPVVAEVRGIGMMVGIQMLDSAGATAAEQVARVVGGCLRRGVIVLGGGVRSNVLSLSPALSILREQLDESLGIIESEVERLH